MTDSRRLVTRKTEHIIGRSDLLSRLERYLHAGAEKHFVYIYGSGGVGKTRVLETVQAMVEDSGEGYYSTGIIDLSHTDSHSTSDVERTIIDALDPRQHYFQRYREAREHYERVRESGTDPQVLEKQRKQLSAYFVEGCRQMAVDTHKLVLLFDTVELLQYESSAVEQLAALDTVDARIKTWLLQHLAELGNVLVVFAGRPKRPAPGETSDPQVRLLADMEAAFGDAFYHQELLPLTVGEAQQMIRELAGVDLFDDELLPVVHLLTEGRPVFLHMVVDLMLGLSETPAEIEALFRKHVGLIGRTVGEEELVAARKDVQGAILRGIFNEANRHGWFLDRLAMMPKGVDAEILHQAVGLPRDDAAELLKELRPLSFIKVHEPLVVPDSVGRQVDPGRIFLHDELYHLLRSKPVRGWEFSEVQVAHMLVRNYYDPQIASLQLEIDAIADPDARVPLRARVQKLQVERLYYLLVHDVKEGYETYKRLAEEANWWRWVGYSNRLLDEFLRYYNDPARRPSFARRGLDEATVIRESAALWSERFYWWGQFDRCIRFADDVLNPEFGLVPADDAVTRATIEARRLDALAVNAGFREADTAHALDLLEALPAVADCTLDQLLARARLSAAIGFQFQEGGLLETAVEYYEEAKTIFRELAVHTDAYRGELAIWLHALAFVYAQQGQILLAMPLVREALRINEALRFDYNIGLTLSALSGIEQMAGQNDAAIRHAQEALDLFRKLEDPHGTTLAYIKLVRANRHKAKQLLENGRKLEEAQKILERDCLLNVEKGIEEAKAAELSSLQELLAELGRSQRDLGHVIARRHGFPDALQQYQEAARALRDVLDHFDLPELVAADVRQDLAEVLFFSHDYAEAEAELRRIVELIGEAYVIDPGHPIVYRNLPVDRFRVLGKVELLRSQMIFSADPPRHKTADLVMAMRHQLLAYAYFLLFSEQALERDNMVDYIYNYMNPVPLPQRREVMNALRAWYESHDFGVDVSEFLRILTRLLT